MPQKPLSKDDLSRMRKAVQDSQPYAIHKTPACGYSGITRTTNDVIYTQLVRFQFPAQAMHDWNNANALKRSIRDIASGIIQWDVVRGRVPTWGECSKTDQLRMIGKVEDRYSWMKCFEAHWLSEVLLGKHVTSKARDIRKASAAHVVGISAPIPSSSLLERNQSNQSDQSDYNSDASERPEHLSSEDDVQAAEVLVVEDDTDNNTLEEDMDENSDDGSEPPSRKRKENTDTGAVDSVETPISILTETAKPPKKRAKASTNQPVPRSTRGYRPSEKVSDNSRISKDVASKKKEAAEKRQSRAAHKAQSQAAEVALLTKQASQRNKKA